MTKDEQILHELKTLSPAELDEVLGFIGYLKFRAATGAAGNESAAGKRPLDIGDA